jgi:hypothetical protein
MIQKTLIIFLEINYPARWGDLNLMSVSFVTPVRVYQSILFQTCQPIPLKFSQPFEISDAPIPTVKHHKSRRKSSGPSYSKHLLKMVILSLSIVRDIVNPELNRDCFIPFSPEKTIRMIRFTTFAACPSNADKPGVTPVNTVYPVLNRRL